MPKLLPNWRKFLMFLTTTVVETSRLRNLSTPSELSTLRPKLHRSSPLSTMQDTREISISLPSSKSSDSEEIPQVSPPFRVSSKPSILPDTDPSDLRSLRRWQPVLASTFRAAKSTRWSIMLTRIETEPSALRSLWMWSLKSTPKFDLIAHLSSYIPSIKKISRLAKTYKNIK